MKTDIREILGDWALDVKYNDKMKTTLFFNSRQNALFVQKIIESDDGGIVADIVPVERCVKCRFWQDNNSGYPHSCCKWRDDETPDPWDFCSGFDPLDILEKI